METFVRNFMILWNLSISFRFPFEYFFFFSSVWLTYFLIKNLDIFNIRFNLFWWLLNCETVFGPLANTNFEITQWFLMTVFVFFFSSPQTTDYKNKWEQRMEGCREGNVGDSVISRNAETRADNVCLRLPTGKHWNVFARTLELALIPLSSDKSGSLVNMSAISWQQRWHAACVSSVQNGAERERAAQASDVWALSHGTERAPRKAPDFQDGNPIPFLLLFQ